MELENTFMNFLLQHQQRHERTLNFVILMESVMTAAKYLEYYYSTGALQRNLGPLGRKNVQGENVMQLDMMAHEIVIQYLEESKQVIEAVSEECPERISLNYNGRYFIYFDPLDGSSNIKHSLPVGLLFGIAKKNINGSEDGRLRKGVEFVAAGMFLIPEGIFTFALRDSGAWRFIKDEAGIYIRPERIHIPQDSESWELSYNAGNFSSFAKPVQKWIDTNGPRFSFRYAGSLAVDFHRLLRTGGMFLYPAIVNHKDPKKNRPSGKLRLLYEAAVVAFIAKEAGAYAVDENADDVLEIVPEDLHQRSALYIGNREVVDEISAVLKG